MVNIKEEKQKGISIDVLPVQIVTIIFLFLTLFILPITVHQLLQVKPEQNNTINESYTADALNETHGRVISDDTGRVAGLSIENAPSEETDSGEYINIPFINYHLGTDFTDPSNLLVLVGGVLVISAIVLFLGMVFNLFKR